MNFPAEVFSLIKSFTKPEIWECECCDEEFNKAKNKPIEDRFCEVCYCEACEGVCVSDELEYCECCGDGFRNGCEMNPSDESIFDGMCDECREEEE